MLTELALGHRVIPGIADFARGGRPAPATTDDANTWVDGFCWLYCGRRWTRVLWIGPATVAGAQAPMYACGPCISTLHELVWEFLLLDDTSAGTPSQDEPPAAEPPTPRRTGKHRGQGRLLRRR